MKNGGYDDALEAKLDLLLAQQEKQAEALRLAEARDAEISRKISRAFEELYTLLLMDMDLLNDNQKQTKEMLRQVTERSTAIHETIHGLLEERIRRADDGADN